MVKALGLIYRRLFPLKQDCPGTIAGRTLRFVKAALPSTPHGSAPMAAPAGQGTPPARETQLVPCSAPPMVMALPVARLTTVLVSHPPAALFRKPFRPSSPGRL